MSFLVKSIYRLLNIPWVYRLSQSLLAPGGEKELHSQIGQMVSFFSSGLRHLDVGCGPSSLFWKHGLDPVGIDLSYPYLLHFVKRGKQAVNGSCISLPFQTNTFDCVWSIGLLHHLPEYFARLAVNEMIRVTANMGHVVIVDNVLPQRRFHRPIAWLLRKLDRGRYVRDQNQLEKLLPDRPAWRCERFSYSLYNLECLRCMYQKTTLPPRNTTNSTIK